MEVRRLVRGFGVDKTLGDLGLSDSERSAVPCPHHSVPDLLSVWVRLVGGLL